MTDSECLMNTLTLSHEDVLSILPDRSPDAHKGNFGRILLLCSSCGYTGAAALCAMGALRSGAGLVYLGVPKSIYQIEATKLTEPIVFALPEADGKYHSSALELIEPMLHKMDAILIGPGMGISQHTQHILCSILEKYQGTVVIDADGITQLADHIHILRGRNGQTILTPHAGEFTRIGGNSENDRISEAVKMATDLGCILLLKGHRTVITDGVTTYVNNTGNPGMAVGGSGDLLAGIIVSLVGQGIDPLLATATAAWLHGRAGDICTEKIGQYGMLPTDMLQELPRLMK